MQLVGEVMGQISDALHNSGVNGFDETKLSNDWGRIILEAAGSAAVAGVTGGNIGAAAGSAVAGNIATASTYDRVKQWAIANSNGDPKLAMALTNAIENAIAGAIGAGAGGAIGEGSGALNGVDISSALQAYNQARSEREGDFRPEERDENGRLIDPLQEAIWKDAYYNNERELRELCKDCSSLTPIKPTITEEMVNLSREGLEAAQTLASSGKPVNFDNIQKVKNGQIDDIEPVADPARENPSETNRPKLTQPTETQWNDFDNPKLPSGSSNNQMNQPKNPSYQTTRNSPTTINERYYTGHALDRMQDRGIPPSVVEDTIKNNQSTGSRNSVTQFYSPQNNISVFVNSTGGVVSVRSGK